jgi:hypothetical protein
LFRSEFGKGLLRASGVADSILGVLPKPPASAAGIWRAHKAAAPSAITVSIFIAYSLFLARKPGCECGLIFLRSGLRAAFVG